jgi:hypothetical protein
VTAEAAERADAAGVEREVMLKPLKGAIIGSTPYRLVHLSQFPVLVVPASG